MISTYLILYAGLVKVVSADRASICADGPRPHRHRIPLLDLEALVPSFTFTLDIRRLRVRRQLYIHGLHFRHFSVITNPNGGEDSARSADLKIKPCTFVSTKIEKAEPNL